MDLLPNGHAMRVGVAQTAADDAARLRDELSRLRQENRRYARELAHLRLGARVVVDQLDTRVLAQEIARLAAVLLRGERAAVGVIEDDRIVLQATHVAGQAQPPAAPHTDPGHGIAQWVVLHRRSCVCNDPGNDPRVGARANDYRNVLCVPILDHQNHMLGVIEVQNRRNGGMFGAEDLRVAETLALQAAIGLARARLFDGMQDWSGSLEMLLAFNAAVNQHLNPSNLVRLLVENAARFLKADGGMAGLVLPHGDQGEVVMISEAYWNRGSWHEQARRWARNEGLPGRLLENEFPYLSNDYQDDPLADADLIAAFDVRRALSVPIKDFEDRLLGFFELHKGPAQSPFAWQDAAFLESLANTTAVAIHNAQLLKTLEIRSEQVRALWALHVARLEEERLHTARELHDEAGQALIAIKLGLQLLARQVPVEMAALREELDHLREQVNRSTGQLKDLAKRLRPPALDQLGIDAAIRQLAADHQDRTGVRVHLDLVPLQPRPPEATEIALYRIAQEALTNTAKHADASQVWLTLHARSGGIEFVVRDDGRGFDSSVPYTGLGLLGIRERVDMLGGQFRVWSKVEEGTHITVVVPAQ